MARRPRIHYPGAVYLVMLRGNGGQDIFFDESDRIRFYDSLEEGVKRFDVRIPAFCLMSNHVHLAMQKAEIQLSLVIRNLSFRYAQYQNSKRQRTGHLFQVRYKAVLIDAESSCTLQGRNPFQFLLESVVAYRSGLSGPAFV